MGLTPHARVALVNRSGHVIATQKADSLGGIVFRQVSPGPGYRLRAGGTRSAAVTVMPDRSAPPSTKVYDQTIPKGGYGYLTTRDGTKLAIDVRLPGRAGPGGGPYPTLVEYAGYGYADPAGAESGISSIATLLGFAVVDVNMRGTGCSGGSFDYFEPLQNLDGYDIIEAVARQPWVLGHRVGMLGISYGGISQLFVGATDPPHLAAIAPLSVVDSTAATLYPGGILNTGFTLGWARDRDHDALPASRTGGEPWAFKRIQQGDRTCKANQVLHGEAVNQVEKARTNHYFVPSVANPLAPVTFVRKIHVPVYLACQFTDEQTGGHCADLAEHFTGTRRKWFTFTNGVHVDSLDPQTFNRWYDFLELYVAHRRPQLSDATKALAPTVYTTAMGINDVTLPPDPIQAQPSYAAALSAFQALKPIRVMFDNGAGSATPGAPYPGFEQSFSRFPIPGTQARSWYLSANGTLSAGRATSASGDEFTWKPKSRSATSYSGNDGPGGLWSATPDYHWQTNPAGTAASYVERAADGQHHRDRRRRGPAVDQGLGAERRPPGHDLRGASRRPRDVRAGRVATRLRAQAGRRPEHAARAGAQPPPRRRRAAARGPLHRGHRPPVLRGPRVPQGLPHPGHDRRPGRRPARLGVLGAEPARDGQGVHRPLAHARLAAGASRRAGGERADRIAALSGPARRAVSRVSGLPEPLDRAGLGVRLWRRSKAT